MKYIFKALHLGIFSTSCGLGFKGLLAMLEVRLPDGIFPSLSLWASASTAVRSAFSFTLHGWLAALIF
jgi:hypothetical protein